MHFFSLSFICIPLQSSESVYMHHFSFFHTSTFNSYITPRCLHFVKMRKEKKKCKKRLQMVRQLFPKVIQIESWQRQTSNIDLLTSNSYQNHDHCFLSFNNTLGVNHNQNLTDELKLCSKVIHSFSYNQILLKRIHWQSTPEIPESEKGVDFQYALKMPYWQNVCLIWPKRNAK